MADLPGVLFANGAELGLRMRQALSQLGYFLGASRAYVMCDEDAGRFLRVAYEWIDGTSDQVFPSWPLHDYQKDIPSLKPLMQGKTFLAVHTRHLAEDLNKVLTKQSVSSLLIVPLTRDGVWAGLVGMDSCGVEREWQEFEVDILRYFSGLVGQVLDREDYLAVRRRLGNVRLALNDEFSLAPTVAKPLTGGVAEERGGVTLLEAERRLIVEALAMNHGNRGAAARQLGIAWAALDRRCKKLKIKLERPGGR